jgi:hypothetical protein
MSNSRPPSILVIRRRFHHDPERELFAIDRLLVTAPTGPTFRQPGEEENERRSKQLNASTGSTEGGRRGDAVPEGTAPARIAGRRKGTAGNGAHSLPEEGNCVRHEDNTPRPAPPGARLFSPADA